MSRTGKGEGTCRSRWLIVKPRMIVLPCPRCSGESAALSFASGCAPAEIVIHAHATTTIAARRWADDLVLIPRPRGTNGHIGKTSHQAKLDAFDWRLAA